jgi:hypothetical protein
MMVVTLLDSSLYWPRALIFPSIAMSDGSPTDYGAELAGGVFDVASQFINQKIVEAIRKNFSGDGKRQRGDFYMGQSRELLQKNF